MKDSQLLSADLVRELLKRLRPIDVSLATRVYHGSALAARPSVEVLRSVEGRLFWLAALTSYAQSLSHSGLVLNSGLREYFSFSSEILIHAETTIMDIVGDGEALCRSFPIRVVRADALTQTSEAMFVYRPEANILYLRRWFVAERSVGELLRRRMESTPVVLPEAFGATFQEFFSSEEVTVNPWQAVACYAALTQYFCVITGGPGTGKTTTIARLVGLLLSLPEVSRPRRICLIAPTGKAADRLRESFAANVHGLLDRLPSDLADTLSDLAGTHVNEPATIHSFLGSRGGQRFVFNSTNLLDCDCLIVDESTMVDLDLFFALLSALPKECRIVLLGDRNQLAAVETGNVFSDLTEGRSDEQRRLNTFSSGFIEGFRNCVGSKFASDGVAMPLIGDHVVELEYSYRFVETSEVGRLAQRLFSEGRLPGLDEISSVVVSLETDWKGFIRKQMDVYRNLLERSAGPEVLLEALNQIRILCAVRGGPTGVEAINRFVADSVLGVDSQERSATHGLPFIVRSNDKNIRIWNGDCGVFYADESNGLTAYLPPLQPGGELRKLNPYSLPHWEAAFAITIHSSQGSEYDSVVVVLAEAQGSFVSWELVYTAITRGRESVSLVLPEALVGSLLPKTRRVSGLVHELGDKAFVLDR